MFSLREENKHLLEQRAEKEALLKRLAAEYTLLGKDCEREKMFSAAIANYKKALELYPDAIEPQRRIKKLEKNHQ